MANSSSRPLAATTALVAWSALVLQYVLLIRATWYDPGPALGSLRYISFFTILSNILVALTTTFALRGGRSAVGGFFAGARARGGVALCIGITSCIYFFLLAATWAPQGAQLLADVAMHYAVPALYLLWWAACVPHGRLSWSDPLRWLAFPLAYLASILLRGRWLHEYPYPFIDVDALGLAVAARNALGVGVLFLAFGFVVVAFDRLARRSA
ncbi:MAG: Pr6Pr family membrane protein [Lysobacterales bacterium]